MANTTASAVLSLDVATQTLIELRVHSQLLSLGLNINADLDAMRLDELANF